MEAAVYPSDATNLRPIAKYRLHLSELISFDHMLRWEPGVLWELNNYFFAQGLAASINFSAGNT